MAKPGSLSKFVIGCCACLLLSIGLCGIGFIAPRRDEIFSVGSLFGALGIVGSVIGLLLAGLIHLISPSGKKR